MIGDALQLLRRYHGLKQYELAQEIKISRSYISELESGKREPSLDTIQKYADFFDLPASSILFFSENIDSSKSKSENRRVKFSKKIIDIFHWLVV